MILISVLGDIDICVFPFRFLEYVPGGSIGECYRKLGRGFDKNLTRHCTQQIVGGLAYLHSKGILHRVGFYQLWCCMSLMRIYSLGSQSRQYSC